MPELHLRNPHSVLAAIEARPREVRRVRAPAVGAPWQAVLERARARGVEVELLEGVNQSRAEDGRGTLAEALVRALEPADPARFFESAGAGTWLVLHDLRDPHNVGAVFRVAAFFGVRGIVLTGTGSKSPSAAAYDVACGGLETVPFALVAELADACAAARRAGLAVLGTSERGSRSIEQLGPGERALVVLGNEEIGLDARAESACDSVYRIPRTGAMASLNVSVAAAVVVSRLALKTSSPAAAP